MNLFLYIFWKLWTDHHVEISISFHLMCGWASRDKGWQRYCKLKLSNFSIFSKNHSGPVGPECSFRTGKSLHKAGPEKCEKIGLVDHLFSGRN